MSIISHVSVGTDREKFSAMIKCYDAFMTELGSKRQMVIGTDGKPWDDATATIEDFDAIVAVAYGKYFPQIWVGLPGDQNNPPTAGNGVHIAFTCSNSDQVHRVYDAAIANGATDNGKPGPRPQYTDKYYGGFFIDPFGNKLEATFYDMGLLGYCDIL